MKEVLTLALLLAARVATAQSTLTRAFDPVVLTGASLPSFIGQAPASLVGFRYVAGAWQQLPVQVDERALLDIVLPYGPQGMGTTYPASPTNPKLFFYTSRTPLSHCLGQDSFKPLPRFVLASGKFS